MPKTFLMGSSSSSVQLRSLQLSNNPQHERKLYRQKAVPPRLLNV